MNTDKSTRHPVFRFKFHPEVLEKMKEFGRCHRYATRQDFKEAFDLWYDKETDCISREATRLTSIGYDGDLKNKMYRSIRYYFNRKNANPMHVSDVKENTTSQKRERTYNRMDTITYKRIVNFIEENTKIKPSLLYDDFVQTYPEYAEDGMQNIKKSFKNIHYNRKSAN